MASASVDVLRKKLRSVWPLLDERARRLMAASEALALAYGGVSAVHRACGLSRKAIAKGIREIRSKTRLEPGRIRRRGAGRKRLTIKDPVCWQRWIAWSSLAHAAIPSRRCAGSARARASWRGN